MSDVFQVEIDKTNSDCTFNEQKVVKRNTSKSCGKQETSDIDYDKKSGNPASTENKVPNSLVPIDYEKCNAVQSATKTYPVNQFEVLKVLQQHFRTIAEEIFGPDTNMFDYLTWIAMGCGLKYVHHCNKTTNQSQNEKINESVARLEKEIDKSSQRKNFDELIVAIENGFAQKMSDISTINANNKTGPEQTKILELQQQLVSQSLELFQKFLTEERKNGSKSNYDTYFTEQELALNAAMKRYSERLDRSLPKHLAFQYKKVQEATIRFKSLINETKHNGSPLKSQEDVEKDLIKLQVEGDGFCNKVLEVMKPTMRVMGPWARRLRRK